RGLRALGVNVTLAPVADAPVPGSVVAGRAFAGEPARSVGEAVRGYAGTRVGSTAKHFPGLGAATQNTDDAAVTIDRSTAELARRDLPPFRSAIAAGTPLVMASHALYPALDGRRIASQSPSVLGALLRRRLRFRGVVITDSIEAEAVIGRQAVEAAAERSVSAGCDLILMTGSGSPKLVYPRLLRAARRSPPFRARVRESASRVLALKRRLGLRAPR
ncbi:MAG: beta-N-acetylglucosaminidase, partial [Actinomycetota bacterium]|nr:beta-N-acetylglucosaminidase [Actinomycetota bacterium]